MSGKKILTNFIKQKMVSYIAGSVILFAASAAATYIPKIIGDITDNLAGHTANTGIIKNQAFLLVGAAALAFILKFIWRYLLIGNCRFLECYLRDNLYKHLETLPLRFYNEHKTGDLVAHAINDIQAIRITFGFGVVAILEGVAINSISIFVMARTIDPLLTLMALGPAPIVVFVMIRLRKQIRQRFTRVQEAFSSISEKVQENLSGIRVIKAFCQENEEVVNFEKRSRERVNAQMRLVRVSAALAPSAQICFGFSFLFFIIIGSRLVANGTISLGDYVAFNTYMALIMGPVMNISRIIEVWQKGMASYKRLEKLFAFEGEEFELEAAGEHFELGDIEIRNLSFAYPGAGEVVLKDINLTLPKGKTLGILGKTGCGKSTLVSLLLKLYEVERGKIFYGGRDINDIRTDVLRECIGCVLQDNYLFSATIKGNIEFFRSLYSDSEIEAAAKQAVIYDNIVEFPEGFNTMVGERGVTLSGGQKQRISIARAIIKKPELLMLDDSLSAVDNITEEQILRNLIELLNDRTGLIISHRVSTVKKCDLIIYMDKGRIVESGSHEELLERKGAYYKLYTLQNAAYGTDRGAAV